MRFGTFGIIALVIVIYAVAQSFMLSVDMDVQNLGNTSHLSSQASPRMRPTLEESSENTSDVGQGDASSHASSNGNNKKKRLFSLKNLSRALYSK